MRVWLAKIDIPGLAMTRSFGDKVGAQAGVIGDPGTNMTIIHHRDTRIQYNPSRSFYYSCLRWSVGIFE